ncbi:MAG: hypothetical protein FWG66_01475 [Spirochaetes bacterium]|nr:hypothetical protein [Spirochaetota bacterium]
MRKSSRFILALYTLFLVCGSLFAFEQREIVIGGPGSWDGVASRANVIEAPQLRPHQVLTLAPSNNQANITPSFDLSISFNEADARFFRDSMGRYLVTASAELESVDRRFARAGTGAGLFRGMAGLPNSGPLVIRPSSPAALFAAGSQIRDFSIEFWLNPFNMENGEEIFLWSSSRRLNVPGVIDLVSQSISGEVSRNRILWTFTNFFVSPDGQNHTNVSFSGNSPIIPRTWSHHLIRFDAQTGMLEYLVNGQTEAIVYTTASGRETGEVFTPVAGEGGSFILGRSFMGVIDEFNIHSSLADRASFQRYPSQGGRVETQPFDLGFGNRGILRVDVRGGRANIQRGSSGNEFRENGRFLFSDSAEMQFFIRTSDNQFLWDDSSWVSFIPGAFLPAHISGGRFVQLAVDFYPSADGESSPFIEDIRIVYSPPQPPMPPRGFTAVAVDGGVYLRWRPTPGVSGFLIYYGRESGVFFGDSSFLGPSPIDVGNRTSIFIEGLANGVLYFFRVAAYNHVYHDGMQARHVGDFSREVSARPLSGLAETGGLPGVPGF